jgi:hypothetical protein
MDDSLQETLDQFARMTREDEEKSAPLVGELIPANDDVIDEDPPPEGIEGDFIAAGENITESEETPEPSSFSEFWSYSPRTGKIEINLRKVGRYLSDMGFGLYKSTAVRTDKPVIFRDVNNVLELHDPRTVKNALAESVEERFDDDDVIDKVLRMSRDSVLSALDMIGVYSMDGFDGTTKLSLAMDDAKTCYLPFKNGVVVITADSIELQDYSVLADTKVWQSAFIPHDITLKKKSDRRTSRGRDTFRDFIHLALKKDVDPSVDDLNYGYDKGADSEEYLSRKTAFETSYGYLIHNYNPPDDAKVVILADVESTAKKAEGRNGKTLAHETLQYYKKMVTIDGRTDLRSASSDSARFNFSHVTLDTKLVVINDLETERIDLKQFFSQITDDFVVQDKNKSKFVIPKDKKPKMSINTNYILQGSGESYSGRQFIVEFGNYFNRAHKKKLKPADILGTRIGKDGFDKDDWDAFYAYGFECVQNYLKNGLVEAVNTSYERKKLVSDVEGPYGSGETVDFLEKWCETERVKNAYHIDGIAEEELFRLFQESRGVPSFAIDELPKKDKEIFYASVFKFCGAKDGYEYNAHLASKGNSRHLRRDRKGPRGAQKSFVRITHRDD